MTMPPIEERFTADSSAYIRALEEMEAAASAADAANARLISGLQHLRDVQAELAGAVTEATGAVDRSTEAEDAAAAAAQAAAEQARALAQAATETTTAEDAAAEAAAAVAREAAAAAAEQGNLRNSFVSEATAAEEAARVLDELAVDEDRLALMADVAAGAITRLDEATAMFAAGEDAAAAAAGRTSAALAGQAGVTTGKAGATDALAGAVGKLAAAEEAAKVKAEASAAALAAEAEAARAAASDSGALSQAALLLGVSEGELAGALHATADDADASETAIRSLAEAAALLGVSQQTLSEALQSTGNALDTEAAGASKAAAASRFFWLTANQWHWVLGVSAEILAVTVPAMIALGAAMDVAAQGAQMTEQHMVALWTACEATGNQFGISAGQALGFRDALQAAQDKANAQVYEALGGALDAVGGKFSSFAAGADQSLTKVSTGFTGLAATGNQVLDQFDIFVAHFQYDMVTGFGQTVSGLLASMVPDLTELSQVLGNFGHLTLNVAADMPGLAEALLKILDAITRLAVAATSLGNFSHYLILVALGAEEFYRWGGLLVTMLGKLGLATSIATDGMSKGAVIVAKFANVFATIAGILPRAAAALLSFTGTAITKLGNLATGAENAGGAFSRMGAQFAAVAEDTLMLAWVGAGIVAIAALGVVLAHVETDAQRFADGVDKAVAAASNLTVMNTLANAIGSATTKLNQQAAVLRGYPPVVQSTSLAFGFMGTSAGVAATKNTALAGAVGLASMALHAIGINALQAGQEQMQLSQAQQKWIAESENVVQGAAMISREYGVNFVGALELAQTAGVHLTQGLAGMSEEAVTNRIRIADLVAGYQAMGQNSSAISSDMEDLAVQSGLAATKVQQLSQAMQQYNANLAGGTGDVAGFAQSLAQIGIKAGSASRGVGDLGKASSINLPKVNQFAQALAKGPVGAQQAWTNFDQIMGQTLPQLAGWFQTAGAEGALGGKQMKQGLLDAISGVIPLAKDSTTAQSQVLGFARSVGINAKSWPALVSQVKNAHGSISGLNSIVGNATGKMSNLEKVAENLGNVMQSDIIATMDKAKVSTSGLSAEAAKLAGDLSKPSTPAVTLTGDLKNIYNTVESLTGSAATARSVTQSYSDSFGKAGQSAFTNFSKMKQAAKDGGTGVASALQSSLPKVTQLGGQMSSKPLAAFNAINLPGKLHTAGTNASSGFASGITSGQGKANSAATNLGHGVASKVASSQGLMRGAGVSVVQGFINGMESMVGSVASAAAHIVSSLGGTVEHLLGIHSPSTVFHKYGMDTIQGLINGLTASQSKVQATITNILNGIKKAFQAGALSAGQDSSLVKYVKADNAKLQKLADERKRIAAQISAAKTYDQNLKQSLTSSASLTGLAVVQNASSTSPLTGAGILSGLKSQLNAIRNFGHDIQRLKKLGLDKNLLNQIIQAGPVQGAQIAAAILQAVGTDTGGVGGAKGTKGHLPSIIDQLNATQAQITKASGQVASQATKAMYDSGEAAGKGMVAGLKKQEKEIDKEMQRIADTLVKRIKKDLKISSPSQVMIEHGVMIAQGLAQGIAKGQPMVETAMKAMAAMVASTKLVVPAPMIAAATGSGTAGGGGTGTPARIPVVAGVNPGGAMTVVNVGGIHVAGHVLTEQQLGDVVRDHVQYYTHNNPTTGLTPPAGRR